MSTPSNDLLFQVMDSIKHIQLRLQPLVHLPGDIGGVPSHSGRNAFGSHHWDNQLNSTGLSKSAKTPFPNWDWSYQFDHLVSVRCPKSNQILALSLILDACCHILEAKKKHVLPAAPGKDGGDAHHNQLRFFGLFCLWLCGTSALIKLLKLFLAKVANRPGIHNTEPIPLHLLTSTTLILHTLLECYCLANIDHVGL